jgi:phage tail sheath protein FI
MPTYLSPGVYVEEVPAGVQSIEGVGTSTGAFVGSAERGELNSPKLITNFTQFVNTFGTFIPDSYLAYTVFGFFAEGGTRCYVTRVAGTGAAKSTINVDDDQPTPGVAFALTATSEGSWGDRISYEIAAPTNGGTGEFNLSITYTTTADTTTVELYEDLSLSTVIAAVNGVSAFVTVDSVGANSPAVATGSLASGADDAADKTELIGASTPTRTGIYAFDTIDDINIVAIPDLNGEAPETLEALNYCGNRGDCFFLVDPGPGLDAAGVRTYRQGGGGQALNSDYGAIYFPWVIVSDPLNPGSTKAVPPSGVVAGTYANTDETRGVHKAPAGTNDGFLNSVVGVESQVTKGEQDILNPIGINVVRSFPQAGIVIWGARTLSQDSQWRYVNVRRLLLFIGESLDEGSQFVVFEPNDPTLWGKVRRTLNAFLTRVWRDGALFGATPEEAFFVKVDEENNPPEVRDAGQLIIDVGVAPVKPAEFVVIRISQQTQAGS